jgi:hypothetical protein
MGLVYYYYYRQKTMTTMW